MRILTLRLSSQDGKISSEAAITVDKSQPYNHFLTNLANAIELVEYKLNVLELNGPWKAEKCHMEQST